jgi:DMSO/TMAO reductase YedYZ heme-binding membrane subunit
LLLLLFLMLLLLVVASVAPHAAIAADAAGIHVILMIAAACGNGSWHGSLHNSWQPFHRLVHAALTLNSSCKLLKPLLTAACCPL